MKAYHLLPAIFAVSFGGSLLALNLPEVPTKHTVSKTAQASHHSDKPWYKVYDPPVRQVATVGCCDYPRAPVWCPMWRIGQAYPGQHVEVPSSDDYMRDVSIYGFPRCHEVIEFPSQRTYEYRIEYDDY